MKNSKTILGITAFYHDSAAALIHDNKVIAITEEERYNLQKHTNVLPTQSIKYCLDKANITIDDVDEIVYYFNPWLCLLQYFLKNNPFSIFYDFKRWRQFRFWNEAIWLANFWKNIYSIKSVLGAKNAKVTYIPHTQCHTWYGLYCMPSENGVVLSNDSMGEYTGVWASEFTSKFDQDGNRSSIKEKKLFSNPDPHSIGYFYGAITKYMGFRTGHHEGKVMALASYYNGDKADALYQKLSTLVKYKSNGQFRFSRKLVIERGYGVTSQRLGDFTIKLLGDPPKDTTNIDKKCFDWAYAFQKITDSLLSHQIEWIKKLSPYKSIVLVGGVGQNSVANGYVSNKFKDVSFHVPPVPYDAGCALGAALYMHNKLNGFIPQKVETAFLGYKEDTDKVIRKLTSYGISYQSIPSEEKIIDIIFNTLNEGKTVAIFNEEMECGPRALGHRTILADPSILEMKDHLNNNIKLREWYRPYGGIIMEEHLKDVLDVKNISPDGDYMSFVYPVKEDWLSRIHSLVHIDKSCRIQIVRKDHQPFIHKLLSYFYEKKGLPILINTSFNVRSQPICRTVEDAISAFYTSSLDKLIINNTILIEK